MTSQQIQRALIVALAKRDGTGNHFELADDIDQAPFRVRAELRDLRRQRLVRETLNPKQHVWTLTGRGWETHWTILRQPLPLGGAS